MYDTDGELLLAAPVTRTTLFVHGQKISDNRSIAESRGIFAGDGQAIIDERDSFTAVITFQDALNIHWSTPAVVKLSILLFVFVFMTSYYVSLAGTRFPLWFCQTG